MIVGTRLRRGDVRALLGLSDAGIQLKVSFGHFKMYRDEDGRPYYDEDEIKTWIAKTGWTGPKVIAAREDLSLRRITLKGRVVAEAMRMILDGKDRVTIILTLKCHPSWVDEAFEEVQQSFETAQARKERIAAEQKDRAETRENAKQQRALEKLIRDDMKARRKKT